MSVFELIHGDCLEKLKAMKDNSIDSIVTDPPYGLSFMGKKWDYDVPSVEIWAECLRVLKPGGNGFGHFDDAKSSAGLGVWPADTGGSAARFFYAAKASKRDRNEGCEGFAERQVFGDEGGTYQGLSNSKNPDRNHHPTVKPTDLMRYLCRLVTPLGGTVLDPFMGSGSTGKAALLEGFRFVGIEREAEYIEIARARISAVQPKLL
jgi:DNA modification methylase